MTFSLAPRKSLRLGYPALTLLKELLLNIHNLVMREDNEDVIDEIIISSIVNIMEWFD
jgi:hypothetical protein